MCTLLWNLTGGSAVVLLSGLPIFRGIWNSRHNFFRDVLEFSNKTSYVIFKRTPGWLFPENAQRSRSAFHDLYWPVPGRCPTLFYNPIPENLYIYTQSPYMKTSLRHPFTLNPITSHVKRIRKFQCIFDDVGKEVFSGRFGKKRNLTAIAGANILIRWLSLRNSVEDRAPIVFIYGCAIFQWCDMSYW